MLKHGFTNTILDLLKAEFNDKFEDIYLRSFLLQYINYKTKAAERDSKSRPSYANLYVIYSLIKDYIDNGYIEKNDYNKEYEGAVYSQLLAKVHNLPFGEKLQNHAFNSRLNDEFDTQFQQCEYQPILRDKKTKRYWFNENLLLIEFGNTTYNISNIVIEIINSYIAIRREGHESFIKYTEELVDIVESDPEKIITFILAQLKPNVDARTFEIVSYAILKYHYEKINIYWGFTETNLNKEFLNLYKTGRTNANDGGIDFVMKPLGRFFQVTETLDFKKYFLDIDKVQKYPITFVIKSEMRHEEIRQQLERDAKKIYGVEKIVDRYMNSIDEIININDLKNILTSDHSQITLRNIIDEIVLQSRIEFNIEDN